MAQKDILLKKTIEYLKSQNWRYSVEEDTIRFSLSLKSKISSCSMEIHVFEYGILARGLCPLKATKDVYGNVVEYLTRANYGLKWGGFEFDYHDGEICFRDFLTAKEGVPSLKDIERIVDTPSMMMQRYGDGLVKSLMGFGDPERDIEAAEEN